MPQRCPKHLCMGNTCPSGVPNTCACETHAPAVSPTLVHVKHMPQRCPQHLCMWNTCPSGVPNTCACEEQKWYEIRQWKTNNRKYGEERREWNMSGMPNYFIGIPTQGDNFSKQWINYLTDLIHIYNLPYSTHWALGCRDFFNWQFSTM